ncbi:hypothetical protein [Paractinoplanes toevensis]|uniref:Uncharacterized protein n=1 Tax=Paractinoplanes toevensis TaxID=571911 RepID=A0A919T5K9_9ACTN|nr:hypothetical protein [Actinoplanes toevensis]GIM89784.1 hypothetical protein Ato02nite_015770 [Actinoplanes toevensis]
MINIGSRRGRLVAALDGWIGVATRFRWAFLPVSVAGAAVLFILGSPYRFTVRLEPGGVRYRQIRTHLTPWQAAPDLVSHRRGAGTATAVLQPGNRRIRLTTEPSYLAAAIREYVTHPENRTELGTASELDRLSALLSSAVPAAGNRQWE